MTTLAINLSETSIELMKKMDSRIVTDEQIQSFIRMLKYATAEQAKYYICVDFAIENVPDMILKPSNLYMLDEKEFNEAWRTVAWRENHFNAVYPK